MTPRLTLVRALSVTGALVGLSVALLACRAVIGSLDECSENADCTDGRLCRDKLCVTIPLDARCSFVNEGGPDAILVGALLPLSTANGQLDQRGVYRRDAIAVAFDQLNPPVRQGIHGRSIRALACDTAGDPTVAADLAKKLVDRGVVAFISASSTETLAVARVTIPAGALLLSSSATSPEIVTLSAAPAGVRLVWRTAPSDALQGGVLANEIRGANDGSDGGALPKVAVIELNNPYGQGLYGAFRAAYDGEQTAALYDRGADVTGAVSRAATFAPDATVIIAFPDDAVRIFGDLATHQVLRQSRLYFSDSAKSPDLLAGVARGSLEGAHGVAPATALPKVDAYGWLVQQLSQKFDEDPSDVAFTSNTFDAAMLIALAFNAATAANVDGRALAQTLTRLSTKGSRAVPLDPEHFALAANELSAGRNIDIEGASGQLDFDPALGEAPAAIEVWRVADGGFVTEKIVNP